MAVEEVVPGAALNLSLNVSPPEKFCFMRPESWTQWKKRFERYLIVSGLSNRTDDEKINVLLYLIGEESEEILLQFAEEEGHLISTSSQRKTLFSRDTSLTQEHRERESPWIVL
jgi:hypothetical protein